MATLEKELSTGEGIRRRRPFFRIINPYLYLIPAFIVMGVITYSPMIYEVWMSFTDYGLKIYASTPHSRILSG